MPDGDIVHGRLSWLYQKPYRLLCEGKLNRDECAWITMDALKRNIKTKGSVPIVLAKRMGESLDQAIENAGNSGVLARAALSMEFDRFVQQANGPHYLKELVRSDQQASDRCLVAAQPC